MRLSAAARELFVAGRIDLAALEALLEEALAHGDPDYAPGPAGLPPWRSSYRGPFCAVGVGDGLRERAALARRERRRVRRLLAAHAVR